MADKKKTRRWVLRAIVAFLAILLILTFFSNTIMNATIPKVVATESYWGNLSYAIKAEGYTEIANKVDVKVPKELINRKVKEVFVFDYNYCMPGDVVLTLESMEESEELDILKEQYDTLVKEKGYDSMLTDTKDYTSYDNAITEANNQLTEAQAILTSVQNKDTTIANAQATINNNMAALVAAQAELQSITDTVEYYNTELDSINHEIDILEIVVDPVYLETNVDWHVGFDMTPPDPSDPLSYVGPTNPVYGMQAYNLWENYQKRETTSALASAAGMRLGEVSAEVARLQAIVDEANAKIDEANQLPTLAQATASVSSAQSNLTSTQKQLDDQKINDTINDSKTSDSNAKRDKEIEDLKKKISDMETSNAITTIEIPSEGMIYGTQINPGDILQENQVLCSILPDDRVATVKLTFSAEDANSMYVGQELKTDDGWYRSVTIMTIKPSSADPRNSREVLCKVDADYVYPNERIVVTAEKGNKNYDKIIPSSAVYEDADGTFVYALVESSSPLGVKYNVKRIKVEVEATDGSQTAIKSDELKKQDYKFVTRSEKPLQDGERVRVQDYSKNEAK